MHESSKITVYNSTWFYHFYAMVSSVIDNTCNNVATPKCISLEKEIFLIICRENRSNQGFHQDPENSNIKWLPRCPSGGHIFKEWQWNSLCRNFFLHFFFPHFFHSPSLAWIFFVLPQHFLMVSPLYCVEMKVNGQPWSFILPSFLWQWLLPNLKKVSLLTCKAVYSIHLVQERNIYCG